MPLGKTSDSLIGDIIKLIIALFLPPVAVLLEVGLTMHFWLNIVLTLLGGIPGMIHALYIVATR